MIVQCCVCKIIEGVKCPECGDYLVEERPSVDRPLSAYEDKIYMCTKLSCGLIYNGRDGGVSHGYCQKCSDVQMSRIPGTDQFNKRVARIAADIQQRGLAEVLGNYNHGRVFEEQ
jgi:hypothetical protein